MPADITRNVANVCFIVTIATRSFIHTFVGLPFRHVHIDCHAVKRLSRRVFMCQETKRLLFASDSRHNDVLPDETLRQTRTTLQWATSIYIAFKSPLQLRHAEVHSIDRPWASAAAGAEWGSRETCHWQRINVGVQLLALTDDTNQCRQP